MKLLRHLKLHEWSRRRLFTWSFCGVAVPFILYFGWLQFGWPQAWKVSREVTYFTEPLTADGKYVNYVQAMMPNADDVDPRDDLWQALMFAGAETPQNPISDKARAAVPRVFYSDPLKVLSPVGPDEEENYDIKRQAEYLIRQLQQNYKAAPQLAELIHKNEPWYQAVLATEPGPVSVEVEGPELVDVMLPIVSAHQRLRDAFDYRMALALAEGDEEKAWESFQFRLQVADRERSVPCLVCQVSASRMESGAVQRAVFAALAGKCSSEFVAQMFRQCVSQANTKFADNAMLESRIQVLSVLAKAHRAGWLIDSNLSAEPFYKMRINALRCRIRWNDLARATNDAYDQLAEIPCDIPYEEWRTRMFSVFDSTREQFQAAPSFDEWMGDFGMSDRSHLVAEEWLSGAVNAEGAIREFRSQMRISAILLSCVEFRKTNERFPASMDELTAADLPLRLPPDVLNCPYLLKPFVLESSGNSLRIFKSKEDQVSDYSIFQWPSNK